MSELISFFSNEVLSDGTRHPLQIEVEEDAFNEEYPISRYSEGLGLHINCGGKVKINQTLVNDKTIYRFFCHKCGLCRSCLHQNKEASASDLLAIIKRDDDIAQLCDTFRSYGLKRPK